MIKQFVLQRVQTQVKCAEPLLNCQRAFQHLRCFSNGFFLLRAQFHAIFMQKSLQVYSLSCLPHSGYCEMKALHSQHSVWKMLQADNKMLQSDLQQESLPSAMHCASILYLLPDLSFTANQKQAP